MAARNSLGYSAGDASSSPNKNPAGRGRARTWASLLHTSIGRMIAYGWPVASPAFFPTGPATGGAFSYNRHLGGRSRGAVPPAPVFIALADEGGIHVSESLYSTKDDFASNGSPRPLRRDRSPRPLTSGVLLHLGNFPMKRSNGFGLFAIIAAIVAYAASLGFFSS